MTNLQINPRKIVQVLLLLTILIVFLMRLHLSFTRAFDPDEFAYLHWAWLSLHGYLPYRDFFFYILPGFLWFLAPVLAVTGNSVTFLIAVRALMVIIYGLCAGVVYKMTRDILRWIPAYAGMTVFAPLFATLIFLTFPVTIDKTIDVRPDMVMLLLYFFSAWIIFQPQKVRPFQAVASGVLFGVSFLVFPKIVFGLPALLYLLISQNYIRPGLASSQGLAFGTRIFPWIMGCTLVGLGFLGYLAINNILPQAIASMTKDALAVTTGKGSFSPLLLLSPYPLIYLSQGGLSLPWAVNTGIWILGLAGLVLIFKKNRHHAIFWGLFIAGNILFVILFPVPYVQYLLPLSVAASILSAYTMTIVSVFFHRFLLNYESGIMNYEILKRPFSFILHASYFIIPVLLLSSFFLQYRERVMPEAGNLEQMQVIRDVLRVTKPDESVYDMVGSYVFRPDGYYICCHPYAEFVDKLQAQGTFDKLSVNLAPPSLKLWRAGLRLSLRESLIATKTKFLVMDRVGFVFWKSLDADKAFLLTNYLPMGNPALPKTPLAKLYSLGQSFRCQWGACVQNDMDGKPAVTRSTNTLTIIAPEKYTVALEPNSSTISIDGKEIHHAQSLDLGTGIHRFTVSPNTLSFHLQLAR